MSKYKSFSKFVCAFCLTAPLAAFDAGFSLQAVEAHVDVINFAFVPNSITVNVNDSVVWTWQPGANFHNVFSDSVPEAWPASPVASAPFTFTNTFNSVGSFPYECTVHLFTGTIVVQSANSPPTVAIVSPTNGAAFTAPANVPIAADANDSDGSVTNVAFFDGGTLLGETNNTPYTLTASLATGSHALTAVVTDNLGLSSTSSVVNVTVSGGNTPPTVTITSPTNGASFTAPANVPITANANDPDGSVTNVAFFDGGTLLGETNTAPYTVTASLVTGSHALTAVATDNLGLSSTSSVVNVTVSGGNTPPSVTITNPPDNSVFGNTDTITIGASASDTDGTVTNVQFFDGLVSLGSRSTSPYSVSIGAFGFALGLHIMTAVASDDLGAAATSAPVHITVARYLPELTNGAFSLFLLPIATNMSAPDYGISPPGDTHRLFVVEQNGLLRIIQDGTLLPGAALDIQSRVQPPLVATNANDERGFLGLAFHPGFNDPASPGYQTLYTYNSEMIPTNTMPTYPVPTTATNNYMNVVNEWMISTTNANVVDPSSRREVISFGKNAANHNGGTITFGPDGYMYLALGDGGNANDVGPSHIVPGGNAQNLITPLGKMLRFDPLNPALNPSSTDPISTNGQYRIPTNNPFQGPGQVPEIYAYGFRNPYRFCFDPVTGDLIEADVGQNNIEEINRIVLGGNYGWAVKEGDFLFNMTNGPSGPAGTIGAPPGNRSPGVPAGLIDPISGPMGTLEYDHNNGISITGGFVYRGTAMPELYGKYIFGDLALVASPIRINGRLFYADLQLGTINVFTMPQFGSEVLPGGLTVHGFGQDADGELYALATNTSANGTGGVVYKLASVRLAVRLSGNLLDISWPIAGASLQTQTNGPGAGIGTNWVTVPDSATTNHVVVPIDQANGSAFYRLAFP
jgi:plastocyanin